MAIAPQPRGVIELDRTPLFQNTQQLLRRAEAEIRLLDRCQPTNAASEREALIVDYGDGRQRAPNFEYAPAPELGKLRQRSSSALLSFQPAARGAIRSRRRRTRTRPRRGSLVGSKRRMTRRASCIAATIALIPR